MAGQGLSKQRLQRLHDVLAGHVERGEMPGLVALVSRNGDVFMDAIGALSFTRPLRMRPDTIFRIASLTKLFTAVAAMILVEECSLRLDDAIERWIPELADRRVLRSLDSEIDDTVPAQRPITVRDLLTYRMGFGSVMAMPGTYPIQQFIRDYRIGGDGPMLPTDYPAPDEWLRRLGSLPLMAQPGERWLYQVSGDVLGLLIARVSGQSLSGFMHDRIFEPLAMKDTGFRVSPDKIDRLPACYMRSPQTGTLELFDSETSSAWISEPSFESGGGGAVSTVEDYSAFARMLLDKGRYDGGQILSGASVELMTADQLTAAQRAEADLFFGAHSSWGLGFAVDIGRTEIFHNPGRFGWTGGFGTTAYADPASDLLGVLFTQRMMDSPDPPGHFMDFWTLAYAATM